MQAASGPLIDFRALDLGDFVSQTDPYFADHWVSNASFRNACPDNIYVVLGAKGVGKSALCRHIAESNQAQSTRQVLINLSGFEYAEVAKQVHGLAKKTLDDDMAMLQRYWWRLFVLHALKEALGLMGGRPGDEHAIAAIKKLLEAHEPQGTPSGMFRDWVRGLNAALEKLFIQRRTHASELNVSSLTAKEMRAVMSSNHTDETRDACSYAAGALHAQQQSICLIVDGIDRVANKTDPMSFNLVIGALVRAAGEMLEDTMFRQRLFVKILMPRELFVGVGIRDLDHLNARQRILHWSPQELWRLLERRVAAAASRAGVQGFMLSGVMSPDAFQYVLRHSMYRPRQLLIYMDEIRQQSSGPKPSQACMERAVKSKSLEHVQSLFEEFKLQMPGLKDLVNAVRGLPSVLPAREMRQKLADAFRERPDSARIASDMERLYLSGLMGRIDEPSAGESDPSGCSRLVKGVAQPVLCEFIFKSGARNFWLQDRGTDAEMVALHPILWEYAAIQPHPDYVIG